MTVDACKILLLFFPFLAEEDGGLMGLLLICTLLTLGVAMAIVIFCHHDATCHELLSSLSSWQHLIVSENSLTIIELQYGQKGQSQSWNIVLLNAFQAMELKINWKF